jgi:hypothetical protein
MTELADHDACFLFYLLFAVLIVRSRPPGPPTTIAA